MEQNELGTICGDTADAPPDLRAPGRRPGPDLSGPAHAGEGRHPGVRELKEGGSRAKFIMISQVSAKEMVARAYSAGVSSSSKSPSTSSKSARSSKTSPARLKTNRPCGPSKASSPEGLPLPRRSRPLSRERRRIKHILSQLGMAGEKGSQDIIELCIALLQRGQTASQVGVAALCAQLSDNPKTMEQRARRALDRGLNHIASLGVEDYTNEFFTRYSARLVPLSGGPGRDGPPPGQGPRRQGQPAHLFRRTAGPD